MAIKMKDIDGITFGRAESTSDYNWRLNTKLRKNPEENHKGGEKE